MLCHLPFFKNILSFLCSYFSFRVGDFLLNLICVNFRIERDTIYIQYCVLEIDIMLRI